MTLRVRVLLAAAITLGLGTGWWCYEAWPAWFGQEITLQWMPALNGARAGRVAVEFDAARLKIDVPGALPDDSPVPVHQVKEIGSVWPAGTDAVRSARLMHRRVVYVQMTAAPSESSGGAAYVPTSVSTTAVDGAINLRVRVAGAEPTGRFQITLAPPLIAVPPGLDENAFVSVVLRVLPSGRHAIVRLRQ